VLLDYSDVYLLKPCLKCQDVLPLPVVLLLLSLYSVFHLVLV